MALNPLTRKTMRPVEAVIIGAERNLAIFTLLEPGDVAPLLDPASYCHYVDYSTVNEWKIEVQPIYPMDAGLNIVHDQVAAKPERLKAKTCTCRRTSALRTGRWRGSTLSHRTVSRSLRAWHSYREWTFSRPSLALHRGEQGVIPAASSDPFFGRASG
jgi:hypothetical protein